MKKTILFLSFAVLGYIIFTGQVINDDSPRWNRNPAALGVYPLGNYVPLPVPPDVYQRFTTEPRYVQTPLGVLVVNPNMRVLPSTSYYQSELYLCSNPANTSIMFGSSNNISTGFSANSGCFVSTNGGANWSGWQVINAPSSLDQRGDPGPAIDKNGAFIFTHLASASNFGAVTGIGANRSTNLGANWTATIMLDTDPNVDKNLTCTDGNPLSPYYGNSYSAWVLFSTPSVSRLARTTNSGANWLPTYTIGTATSGHNVQGHDLACGPNGEVYVTWALNLASGTFAADYLGFSKSTNGGANFVTQDMAVNVNGARSASFGGWGLRVNDFPRIAVDNSGGARNGWIYIVLMEINNGSLAGTDEDVVMYVSSNGGTSFTGHRVNQDAINNGKRQFFPAVCVDPFGGVNVVYYDNRNFSNADSAGVFMSRSLDGGNTFADVEISDHHFKPKPATGMSGGYMGDYIGIAYSAGKVFGMWMDDKAGSSGFYNAWVGSLNVAAGDLFPPTITYTPFGDTTNLNNRTLTVNINDTTGVYTTGTLIPNIYYKRNYNGTYKSATGTKISGTGTNGNWNFVINYSALGGVALYDTIKYFVIAQDSSASNNITANPGTGLVASNVNTISVYPTNPNSYKIYSNDLAAPVITYTALGDTASAANRIISANITDITGVYTTGSLMPRVYFKKNYNGSWQSGAGAKMSGTGVNGNWNFTINNASVGGVLAKDTIRYFVIAEDSSLANNISANPGAGLVASSVNTITNYPTSPNQYKILVSDWGAPVITYTALIDTMATTNRYVLANIKDTTGVYTTGSLIPRIYFKRNYNGTWQSGAGVKASGTGVDGNWNFTINNASLGGVYANDTVRYFVIAQDSSTSNNVSANPGTGLVASSVNTVTTYPSNPNSYKILPVPVLFGTYHIGWGKDFPNLDSAVKYYNAVTMTGPVNYILDDAVDSSFKTAQFPITIVSNPGASPYFQLTISPNEGTNVLIGKNASAGVLKLDGAQYVSINGANDTSVNGRNLTIMDSSETGACVHLESNGDNAGAYGNSILNCIIIAGSNTNPLSVGIFSGGSHVDSAGADNDSLRIRNNLITRAFYGIKILGKSSGSNDWVQINDNTIGSDAAPNYAGKYGIYATYLSGSYIKGNTVKNLISSAITGAVGVYLGAGITGTDFYKNTIRDVRYSGSGSYGGAGLIINTGLPNSSLSVYNNTIFNISGKGSSSLTDDAIAGIKILGASGGIQLYFNSVNLSGQISRIAATNDKSAGLYVGASATTLNIRNNVFMNSVDNIMGIANAFAIYSDAGSSAYTNIDFNDYYATGGEGMLGYLGGMKSDIGSWRTATGKDVSSFATNPSFQSVTDLQPQPGSSLLAAGTVIAGIGVDKLDSVRANPPSVGAFEKATDAVGPQVNFTALGHTTSTTNRSLAGVTIIDPRGTNITAGTRPRIYYRRASDENTFIGNTSASQGWKYAEATGAGGSPFTFNINYALLSGSGSVALNDTIYYFITAQDLYAVPNVSITTGSFNVTPSSVDLTSAAFPVTGTNFYKIVAAPLAGTYTVGVSSFRKETGLDISFEQRVKKEIALVPVDKNQSLKKNKNNDGIEKKKSDDGQKDMFSQKLLPANYKFEFREVDRKYSVPVLNGKDYTGRLYTELKENGDKSPKGIYGSLNLAIADLNERGISGPVTFVLTDASYSGESLPILIDSVAGTSAVNTVTIKPSTGVTTQISGAYSGGYLFNIRRTSYITIDGSNAGTNSKNLTISNTASDGMCLYIGSSPSVPVNDITVKNCILSNGNSNFSTLVIADGYPVENDTCRFRNISVINNTIIGGYYGMYIKGSFDTLRTGGSNVLVENNLLNPTSTDSIQLCGIYLQGIDSAVIRGNEVGGLKHTEAENKSGIWIASGSKNITVEQNKIHDIWNTNSSGYGARGISISRGMWNTVNKVIVRNNVIYNIAGNGSSFAVNGMSNSPSAIYASGNQKDLYIYNNSVYMYSNKLNSSGAYSGGISLDDYSCAYVYNNNVVNNSGTLSGTGTGAFAIGAETSAAQFLAMDNNNFYCNTSSGTNSVGKIGGTDYATLILFTAATPDLNMQSYSGNPVYNSLTDLRPDSTNVICWILNQKGQFFSDVTNDFRGLPRSTTMAGGPTDIGAYEFTPVVNPPVAVASGPPSPGGTTNYIQNTRKLIEITWGAAVSYTGERNVNKNKSGKMKTDALPTTVNVQYFSGVTPPDTSLIPVARTGKGYWIVDTDVEPSNSFDLTVYWGNQELGTVADTSKLILAMYDLRNRVWLPFHKAYSGTGNSIINHTVKTITVNGLTRADSVIFALTDEDAPLKRLRLDLTCLISGFYYDRGSGSMTMLADTIRAIIRDTVGPAYTPVDTLLIYLDSLGRGYGFTNKINTGGYGYYYEINHRNSLSTWTLSGPTGQIFPVVTGANAFDFTTAQTQAYGNNLVQIGSKWCIINGDCNRDGYIDGSDYLEVINHYDESGYLTGDNNGDSYVDGSDYLSVINSYDMGSITPMNPVKKKVTITNTSEAIKKMMNEIKQSVKKLNNGN